MLRTYALVAVIATLPLLAACSPDDDTSASASAGPSSGPASASSAGGSTQGSASASPSSSGRASGSAATKQNCMAKAKICFDAAAPVTAAVETKPEGSTITWTKPSVDEPVLTASESTGGLAGGCLTPGKTAYILRTKKVPVTGLRADDTHSAEAYAVQYILPTEKGGYSVFTVLTNTVAAETEGPVDACKLQEADWIVDKANSVLIHVSSTNFTSDGEGTTLDSARQAAAEDRFTTAFQIVSTAKRG